MSIINVGLDFGTSQSKICSKNMEGGYDFIFHKFSLNDDYMLPSTIKVHNNGTLEYGLNEPNLIRYFKMKALYDKHPNYQIPREKKSNTDDKSSLSLAKYPELCCILYLAYCIIDVKYSFATIKKVKKQKSTLEDNINVDVPQKVGLLSRLFKKKDVEKAEVPEYVLQIVNKHSFIITAGIPTQYDNTKEEKEIRSKQYEMVYLAMKLAECYSNPEEYTLTLLKDLLDKISDDYVKLPKENLTDNYYNKEHGLLIIAETTAGIISFRNEIQRNGGRGFLGNYITMDVGAGTTDISFFNLYRKRGGIKLSYYASKSIPIASNFLIGNYLNSKNEEDIAKFDIRDVNSDSWNLAQRNIKEELFQVIRKTILPRLYLIFGNGIGTFRSNWAVLPERIHARGCKVYGGGSRFNEFHNREQLLNGGGIYHYNNETQVYTWLEKFINPNEFNLSLRKSNGDAITVNSITHNKILTSIDILNIALGLAQVDINNRPDGEKGWIELYKIGNEDKQSGDNGLANYDVYNRDWI